VIVYLVEAEYGEYSDYCRIPLCAFYSMEHAEQRIESLRSEAATKEAEHKRSVAEWHRNGRKHGEFPAWPMLDGTQVGAYGSVIGGLQITEIELS